MTIYDYYLNKIYLILIPGGFIIAIRPTIDQVVVCLRQCYYHDYGSSLYRVLWCSAPAIGIPYPCIAL